LAAKGEHDVTRAQREKAWNNNAQAKRLKLKFIECERKLFLSFTEMGEKKGGAP